jgi:hypothetical protein
MSNPRILIPYNYKETENIKNTWQRRECYITYDMGPLLRKTMLWLRQFAAGLSQQRPVFDPRPVHVGCMVDKVVLGWTFS